MDFRNPYIALAVLIVPEIIIRGSLFLEEAITKPDDFTNLSFFLLILYLVSIPTRVIFALLFIVHVVNRGHSTKNSIIKNKV